MGMMHERVISRNVDCGRVAVAASWDMDWIPAEYRGWAGEANEQWRNRLRGTVGGCVRADGGHFQHFL